MPKVVVVPATEELVRGIFGYFKLPADDAPRIARSFDARNWTRQSSAAFVRVMSAIVKRKQKYGR